eukprot:UN13183
MIIIDQNNLLIFLNIYNCLCLLDAFRTERSVEC